MKEEKRETEYMRNTETRGREGERTGDSRKRHELGKREGDQRVLERRLRD